MGLLSKVFGGGSNKPQKPAKPKVVKNGDWETHIAPDGAPTMFYKKGKEWLDASKAWASPSRTYFLLEGFDGKSDACIALTTQTEGLRIKKVDDGVEQAIVTDAGVAYILSDEGTLYTMTADKASQKALATDDRPEAFLLTSEVAAVAVDDGEKVSIRAVDLTTGKAWKKAIKYEETEELGDGCLRMTAIKEVAGGIEVTIPDGTAHLLTTAGNPLA